MSKREENCRTCCWLARDDAGRPFCWASHETEPRELHGPERCERYERGKRIVKAVER